MTLRLLATIHYPSHGSTTTSWRDLTPPEADCIIRAMVRWHNQPGLFGTRFEFTLQPMVGHLRDQLREE